MEENLTKAAAKIMLRMSVIASTKAAAWYAEWHKTHPKAQWGTEGTDDESNTKRGLVFFNEAFNEIPKEENPFSSREEMAPHWQQALDDSRQAMLDRIEKMRSLEKPK